MVMKESLCEGTLALVDTDTRKLDWMKRIADRCVAARRIPLRVLATTDRKKVLKGADFVILAFANEGVKLRGVDSHISTKHGMVMCSGDTIGPGGTMRTLREVPRQNAILQDVRRLCPDAWVINWVNPTAAMGIAMMRHFPDLKTLAICDGPHNPHFDNNLIVQAKLAAKPEDVTDALRTRVTIRAGGVNHFNWLVEMTHAGRDVTPQIKESVRAAARAATPKDDMSAIYTITKRIAWQLADTVGYVPLCTGHTREYLPYFNGHDVNKRGALVIREWPINLRWKMMHQCWDDMQAIASGKRPVEDFLEKTTADHASDIIEAMWMGLPKKFYINTRNGGAVINMTDDAYLEIPCMVSMNRLQPLPFGPMPRPILGYLQRVLDEHELAVEAAVTHDRRILRQAFLASMVAVSIPDVDAAISELLARERAYLPSAWFK
jgi:alpha-galactosidase